MGYWSDLINDLVGFNLISGRKNSAANVRTIFGGITEAIAFLEGLQRGAKILGGITAPDPADGIEGDAYMNTTTGDFYLKDGGGWGLAVVLRGKDGEPGKPGRPGRTPVLGLDYTVTNGTDGKSAYQIWSDAGNPGTQADFLESLKGAPGTIQVVATQNHWESYAPTNDAGTVGEAWFHSISAAKIAIYECLGGTPTIWRLRFTSPDPVTNTTSSGGSTNGVTLTSSGDGTKFLANDGTYKTVAGGGPATTVDADLLTNPASATNAASVKAVNDVVGILANLKTSVKTSLVAGINALSDLVTNLRSDVGTLASLNTTAKGSLVGAINELAGLIPQIPVTRNVYDVDSQKKSDVVSANAARVYEGQASYFDKEFYDSTSFTPLVYGFKCVPIAEAGATNWYWIRREIK